MRKVLLATGNKSCRLFLKRDDGGIGILDMDDYFQVPQVGAFWREAGVRYVTDAYEAEKANALALISRGIIY
jgi:hypothetical protein